MPLDLTNLRDALDKQEKGVEIEIQHPVSGNTGFFITVASIESERVKQAAREMGHRDLIEQRRNPKKVATLEEQEDRVYDIAVSVIVDWRGLQENGVDVPFSRERARQIFEAFPFIAEQVDRTAGDRALFFGK